jgi:hypothetical protein
VPPRFLVLSREDAGSYEPRGEEESTVSTRSARKLRMGSSNGGRQFGDRRLQAPGPGTVVMTPQAAHF